jgi:hypothetical protein
MAFADTAVRTILYGSLPVPVLLAGTVHKGAPLAYSAGFVEADANAALPALLVAAEDGISGQTITAYESALLEGVTGGTPGNPVFLSDTVGKYTETPSTTEVQLVGITVSATRILINQIARRASFVISYPFAAANIADQIFVAPRACRVRKISVVATTVAGQAGVMTVERCQGTEAPAAGDDLTAGLNIATGTMVANTVYNPTLTTTVADLDLAVGNRLVLKLVSGAATSLAGACITVHMEWL